MVPLSPAIQTSLEPVPNTPLRESVVLTEFVDGDQAVPFQWRIVAASPAIQTSFALAPHTLLRLCVPCFIGVQVDPFQCAMKPASPTTQTSVAEKPQIPFNESVDGAGEGDTRHQNVVQPPSAPAPASPVLLPESAPLLDPLAPPLELDAPLELVPPDEPPLPDEEDVDEAPPPELEELPWPEFVLELLPQPAIATTERTMGPSLMIAAPRVAGRTSWSAV